MKGRFYHLATSQKNYVHGISNITLFLRNIKNTKPSRCLLRKRIWKKIENHMGRLECEMSAKFGQKFFTCQTLEAIFDTKLCSTRM